MFNRKTKKISRVPSKEEGLELIGEVVDGVFATNIEINGQVRVLPADKFDKWKNAIPKWKRRYKMVGLQSHPGTLLTEHESEEYYEAADEADLIDY